MFYHIMNFWYLYVKYNEASREQINTWKQISVLQE